MHYVSLITYLVICSHIDGNKAQYIKTLADSVAIKSVSAWPESRPECVRVMKWFGEKLKELGAAVEYRELGQQVTIFQQFNACMLNLLLIAINWNF